MNKLIHGEALEEMQKLIDEGVKVDAIITDPPYGMGFQSSHRKVKHNKIINDDNIDWLDDCVDIYHDILEDNGAVIMFCSMHNIDKFKQSIERKFKLKNILIWEKNNTGMGDLKGSFAPKYEFIIFAVKGRVLLRGRRDADIIKFARTRNELHPTQKPVDLMEYLITKLTDENMIVLDSFMGSGSTGVACKNTGRKFIGIELDEDYYNISKRRINE